jgi:hypothetical protein
VEQQVVDDRLVLIGDRRDLGGQCEDHVEIADRQQIGLAGRQPILRRRGLTLWAMAVATCNGKRPLHVLWVLWANSVMGAAVQVNRCDSIGSALSHACTTLHNTGGASGVQ